MQTIKTMIDIGATPEIVWRVLTDFSSYPRWNPFLRAVWGSPMQGQRLKVRVRMPQSRAYVFTARVVKALPAAEFCWQTKMWIKGLFDGEHAFIIVPNGVEGVKFIQRKHFSGLLLPLIFPFIQKKTLAAFELMNSALKKIAEAKR